MMFSPRIVARHALAALIFVFAATAVAAEWRLSDAPDIEKSVVQGWGKARRDKSVDGKPLVVDGKHFSHGIGTHADSSTFILLDGNAQTICGSVGINDATNKKGSVFFSIMDVEKYKVLWESPLIRGGDSAVSFNINIQGVRQLALFVNDSGDGNQNDHANWLDVSIRHEGRDPVLSDVVFRPDEPGNVWKMSREDFGYIKQEWGKPGRDRSVDGKILSVGGIRFRDGVGTHAKGEIFISLDGQATDVTGLVGVDDETRGRGSVTFQIIDADARKTLWDSKMRKGGERPVAFNVPLAGVKSLLLRVGDAGDGNTNDHADWLDVRIDYNGREPVISEGL